MPRPPKSETAPDIFPVTREAEQRQRAVCAQELLRKYIPSGVSLADELIAERRREAEAERD